MTAIRYVLAHVAILSWLGLAITAGWAFIAWMSLDMRHPWVMLMMPATTAWGVSTVMAVFAMWAIMMVAMMLPSAAPMLLTFDRLERSRRQENNGGRNATLVFVAAYVTMWVGFAVAATASQWILLALGLITPMIESASVLLTAAALAVAGAYQLSPWKDACLHECRTPMGFLITEWQPGYRGAWRMGLKHGLYCLGCCWALMLLMLVLGAMNPFWIVILTVVIAAEKLMPPSEKLVRDVIGWGLLVASVIIAAASILKS